MYTREHEPVRGTRMRALLVRVGADTTEAGGRCNGPVNSKTREFAYVPIPEGDRVRYFQPDFKKPYSALEAALVPFNFKWPDRLVRRNMHLDPDFEHSTYGDRRQRGKRLRELKKGDWIVFYAGLRDPAADQLVYAIIGKFEIDYCESAKDVDPARRHMNAHSRRIVPKEDDDVICYGSPDSSGRLERSIPIGGYRKRAYRVRPDLLGQWSGISANDGYIQRSVYLPEIGDPKRFAAWFKSQKPILRQANN